MTPLKVIEVSINRKPACDFLLVINSNWHPISYRFGVIAAYCSTFGHFAFEPPLGGGGLATTYDLHLGIIGKRVVDFLLVLIKLFSLGITAEALRAKIDKKSLHIFIPYERSFCLVFFKKEYFVGGTLSTRNFVSNWTSWSEIVDFRSIFSRSASAVTPSEKVQLTLIGSPMSPSWKSYVVTKPPKGGSKTQCPRFKRQTAITSKRYEIGCQLLLVTNKKSHTGFRLIPISMILNDL